MADNITLNSGSGGSTAWTDEVTGSKHAQIVKLADGTADSTTVIASGNGVAAGALRVTLASDGTGIVSLTTSTASIGKLAANSGVDIGDVDITSIAAGDNNIGNVDIASALPAGTNNIGDVDVLTVPADPFGANADAASATGSISAKLRFIAGTGIPITGTVTVGSHAVTNAGTFVTQIDGAALTAFQLIDDMIYADDGAWTGDSSKHGLVGGIYQSAPQTITDGRTAPIQLNANGYQIVTVNGTVTVGSHAVTNAGTFVVQLDGAALTSLQLIDDAVSGAGFNISQLNGVAVTMGNGASGTGVQRVTMANDSTGILAGVTTVTTVTTLGTLTGGGVAHDSADSGNPVKVGAIATTSLLGRTPVANADRSDLVVGSDGALLVRQGTSLEDIISEQKTNTDGAATAMTGAFAATASQRIYLTDIIIANSSATNITVDIRDGSAGSVLATFPVPATGGVVHRFCTPLRFTANTAAAFDGSAAATTLSVTMLGFKSKT